MRVLAASLFLLTTSTVEGFVPSSGSLASSTITSSPLVVASPTKLFASVENKNDNGIVNINANEPSDANNNNDLALMTSAVSMMTWLSTTGVAEAAGPDWGIFEGRTGSLLHPLMMGGLLTLSLSTALLGFNWRRQRTMGDEITTLKKSLPDLPGDASTLAEGIAYAKENDDTAEMTKLQNALPIQKEIDELIAERKELSSKNVRDNHFSQGALLAFLGTAFAIEGPLNTYARAGKLFPGPHLYAGAGLVVCWALAVACVPAMQKGNDTARTIHIGANIGGLGLFAWQVVSGIPILLKVVELTKWP